MDEIRDNAQVVDPDGKVDSDKEIVQPDNENEAIAGVDEDREYDGPAYDKDGNIIVQSKSYTKSSNEETCTVNNVNANVKLLVKSLQNEIKFHSFFKFYLTKFYTYDIIRTS